MERVLKCLKNKKGISAIYSVIMISFLLPFLMFVSIDLNHYMQQNRRLKNVVDNSASSAITMIDENRLAYGVIEVSPNEAREVILRVLKESLFLNDDLTPKKESVLKKAPEISIHVVNNPLAEQFIETPIEKIKIKKTTVLVYAKFDVKGLFFGGVSIDMQKVGMSEVGFKQ